VEEQRDQQLAQLAGLERQILAEQCAGPPPAPLTRTRPGRAPTRPARARRERTWSEGQRLRQQAAEQAAQQRVEVRRAAPCSGRRGRARG